jgi:asparagine synthase (glutamine-hydrolysing)
MTNVLTHRGPDDEGQWISDDGRMALGQRRLSIIDLSPAGHQPMVSASGRFVITYNGEIYNFRDIKRELESTSKAPPWRGHSDTEVLLAAIEAWGLEAALKRTAGMFAIALWDKSTRTLSLARDRFGEKPLYYGSTNAGFAFASELKAIRSLPGFDNQLNSTSLRHMLGTGYVPKGCSIFEGIKQITPGHIAMIASINTGEAVKEYPYYDYAETVGAGYRNQITDKKLARELLEASLSKAVARQLVADVPVGAFLSGGIDSSIITALAAKISSQPVKTFSIGFAEAGYDEAPHARAVAKHLGTDHHELYVSTKETQAVIPMLPNMYDEPFGDSSQIPTYLVSQFARQHVTVALTGDAGDEIFGGYNRHKAFPALWRRARVFPAPLRGLLFGGAGAVTPKFWNALGRLSSGHARPEFYGHKVRRTLQTVGTSHSLGGLYGNFLDEWLGLPSPVTGEPGFIGPAWPIEQQACDLPFELQIMLADALTYLPGDILTKVDRAAMAVSLEGRVPFLDPDVVALAARIPVSMKFADGNGKAILRDMLYSHVPRELIDRPKAGFSIPVGQWLKGELRDWAEDLLSENALLECGALNPDPIRKRWERHLAGREDASQAIWSVLMFQAWRRG